jgi:hypothetical protein
VADLTTTFALTIPSLAVLIGILLNQYGIGRLDRRIDRLDAGPDKMDEGTNKMEASPERRHEKVMEAIGQIQLDRREFYRTLGQHEVRVAALEKAAPTASR